MLLVRWQHCPHCKAYSALEENRDRRDNCLACGKPLSTAGAALFVRFAASGAFGSSGRAGGGELCAVRHVLAQLPDGN